MRRFLSVALVAVAVSLSGGCPLGQLTNDDPDPNASGEPNTPTTTPDPTTPDPSNPEGPNEGPADSDPNTAPNPNQNQNLDPAALDAAVSAAIEKLNEQRAYGDGSAGDRVISSDLRIGDQGDVNLQYVNFTIEAGVTMTVQSGTVIRCTESFVNHGTIVVQNGTEGARRPAPAADALFVSSQSPQAGVSTLSAASGEAGGDSANRAGGSGGEGLSEFESRVLLNVGTLAGGGGGASFGVGGDGGGSFGVRSGGSIVNTGAINAPGEDGVDGSGAGAGGTVIFLAKESITNVAGATVMADGGTGGAATSDSAPGGGGGGGVVHFLAPATVNDGAVSVAGGASGANGSAASVTASIRTGGGGGGASGGDGGSGGAVDAGASADPQSGGAGDDGFWITTTVDPTTLL